MSSTSTTSLPTQEDIATWRINLVYLARRFPTTDGLAPFFVEDLLPDGPLLDSRTPQDYALIILEAFGGFTDDGLAPVPAHNLQPTAPSLTEAETIELKLWGLTAMARLISGDMDPLEFYYGHTASMVYSGPAPAPGPSVAEVD